MVINVDGPLNCETAIEVRSRLFEAVRGPGGEVLADVSAVASVDSAGLAVLIEAFGLARRLGNRFGLLDPSRAVTTLLDVMRLGGLFPIERRDLTVRRQAG